MQGMDFFTRLMGTNRTDDTGQAEQDYLSQIIERVFGKGQQVTAQGPTAEFLQRFTGKPSNAVFLSEGSVTPDDVLLPLNQVGRTQRRYDDLFNTMEKRIDDPRWQGLDVGGYRDLVDRYSGQGAGKDALRQYANDVESKVETDSNLGGKIGSWINRNYHYIGLAKDLFKDSNKTNKFLGEVQQSASEYYKDHPDKDKLVARSVEKARELFTSEKGLETISEFWLKRGKGLKGKGVGDGIDTAWGAKEEDIMEDIKQYAIHNAHISAKEESNDRNSWKVSVP